MIKHNIKIICLLLKNTIFDQELEKSFIIIGFSIKIDTIY